MLCLCELIQGIYKTHIPCICSVIRLLNENLSTLRLIFEDELYFLNGASNNTCSENQ